MSNLALLLNILELFFISDTKTLQMITGLEFALMKIMHSTLSVKPVQPNLSSIFTLSDMKFSNGAAVPTTAVTTTHK